VARRWLPAWRADAFRYWTASGAVHAVLLCVMAVPQGDVAPPKLPRQPWAVPGEPCTGDSFRDVPPATALSKSRGYEDAISDIPLGGTGVSSSLGAGGGGLGGVFGSGPVGPGQVALRLRVPPAAQDAARAAADWLLRHQKPDGHWEPCAPGAGGPESASVPATALALLAIAESGAESQAAEAEPRLRRALAWLERQQHGDGAVYGRGLHRSAPAWEEYGHTLAALALVQGWERFDDPSAREPARRALAFSLARHSAGFPGWNAGGAESAADHAGWHLTLLRRAREAGFFLSDGALRKPGLALAALRRREATSGCPGGRRTAWRGARVAEVFAAAAQPDLAGEGLGLPPPAAPRWPARDLGAWRWSALAASLGDAAWRDWAREAGTLLARKQLCGGPLDGSESDLDGSWEPPPGEAEAAGPCRGRLFATALGALILASCRGR